MLQLVTFPFIFQEKNSRGDSIVICGVDLGSRMVKIALKRDDGSYIFYSFDTISFYRQYGRLTDGKLTVELAWLGLPNYDKIVATGYGRYAMQLGGAEILPEPKAHTLGAMAETGLRDFTLIDIGGQDTKVVKVLQGKMVDFQTNDKCAASSGRYLENMATALDVSLDEMGRHYKDPITLSSTCAVFGESEVIGCLAEGKPIEAICAGVNYSVVRRVMPDVRRMPSGNYVLSGGVGRNNAVRHLLEQELRTKLIVPKNHFFLGAIGCCNAE